METRTHGDGGGLEVFVFLRVISVKFVGFLVADGKGLLIRESFSLNSQKNSLSADRRLWWWIIVGRP